VSRAVRAPARLDRDIISPDGIVVGGPDFVSEVANVFEIGYRGRPLNVLTFSATAFRHNWDQVRSGTGIPVRIENRIEGPVYGAEMWAAWQAAPSWRVIGGFTTLRKGLELEPGSTDPVGVSNPQLANDPEQQWVLRSALTLRADHDVDATLRYVGSLPNPVVPPYTTLHVRYAWRPVSGFEVALNASDLLGDAHPEFGGAASRSVFGRAAFVQARWFR